jgi:ribosomal protein L37E
MAECIGHIFRPQVFPLSGSSDLFCERCGISYHRRTIATMTNSKQSLSVEEACEKCGDTNGVDEATELCADCYFATFGTWPEEEDEAAALRSRDTRKEGP